MAEAKKAKQSLDVAALNLETPAPSSKKLDSSSGQLSLAAAAELRLQSSAAADSKTDTSPSKLALPRGVKLMAHERDLLERGLLRNIAHANATSVWLEADSTVPGDGQTTCYRPMGDAEVLFLVQNGQLPGTQPYQAIIEGENGRAYAEKYLNGQKRVDTLPSSVVEFVCPKSLIEQLFALQVRCFAISCAALNPFSWKLAAQSRGWCALNGTWQQSRRWTNAVQRELESRRHELAHRQSQANCARTRQ